MDIEILGLSLTEEISSENDIYDRLSSLKELSLPKANIYSIIRHLRSYKEIPDSYLYKINHLNDVDFYKSDNYNMKLTFETPVKVNDDIVTQAEVGIFKTPLLIKELRAKNEAEFIRLVEFLFELDELVEFPNIYTSKPTSLKVYSNHEFNNSKYSISKEFFSNILEQRMIKTNLRNEKTKEDLMRTVYKRGDFDSLSKINKDNIYKDYLSEKGKPFVDKIELTNDLVNEYTLSTEEFIRRLGSRKEDPDFKLGTKLIHKTNAILAKYISVLDDRIMKFMKLETLKILIGVNNKLNYYKGEKKDIKVSMLEYFYIIGIIHYIYRNKKVPIRIKKLNASATDKEESDMFISIVKESAHEEIKSLGLSETKIRNLYVTAVTNVSDIIVTDNISSLKVYRDIELESALEMKARVRSEVEYARLNKLRLSNVIGTLTPDQIRPLEIPKEEGRKLYNLPKRPIKAFVHSTKWTPNSEYPNFDLPKFDPSNFSKYFENYCPINYKHSGVPCRYCDFGKPKIFFERFKHLILSPIVVEKRKEDEVQSLKLNVDNYRSIISQYSAKWKLKTPNALFNLGKTENFLVEEIESKVLDVEISKYHVLKINAYSKKKYDILNITNKSEIMYKFLVMELIKSTTKEEIDDILKRDISMAKNKLYDLISGDHGEDNTDYSVNYMDINPTLVIEEEEEYEEDDDESLSVAIMSA